MVFLTIALALFTTENVWCACAGTACLFIALLLIRWADSNNQSDK